jgi:radical SAM protein with 4Fe4S-binding SPASM domain
MTGQRPAGFDAKPYIVIWETTRSCALKCLHCRAEAIDRRDPDELTTTEAFALMDQIARLEAPLTVLTGGDPMRRPDILEIVRYGTERGLRLALTPSGTPEMTRARVGSLKEAGLARLAVSLDGSTAEIHDSFRRVPGSYGWTLDIIRWASEAGLPAQINTTITRYNLDDFDRMAELMLTLPIVLWSVFFLVPVGRGSQEDQITAAEYEAVFHKMADLAEHAPFDIKSTEAPHYRRVLLQRGASGNRRPERAAFGVNDGKGFVFVSHKGEVWPSGFLPLSAGNVKRDDLGELYRDSPLFRDIRDYSRLGGKCGLCEYKNICGGSRARAYALTGDIHAADPFCGYQPARARAAAGHEAGVCTPGADMAESNMAAAPDPIQLFEGLTDAEREAVSRQLTEKRFKPGETIFSPGDACLKVFFVRSGRVRIKRASACGREQTFDTLKAGDSCACHPDGENMKCASFAEAMTDCTVWFMARDKFTEWVRKAPAVSQSLNRHLAAKLRNLSELVEDLSLSDARSRLVRRMLQTAVPDGSRQGAPTVCVSQEDLARDIGVTRETVARQLTALRRSKLIATRPRRIVLLDRESLKKLV